MPIELHMHNVYAIAFIESMKQFWHQPIKRVEQKTSKQNHVSSEFDAWSFLQNQGSLMVEVGKGLV